MQDAGATQQSEIEPPVTLEGVVERIVYENADTGFMVARMRQSGASDLCTFVGNLLAISPGETVRLRGAWVEDKKFARQLRVSGFETLVPTTATGIEAYLGSGLINGIGPKFAARLVKAFGVETLRVIGEEPRRLLSVPGIGRVRAARIREAWEEHKALQSIMIFLQGHGITAGQAVKIYKCYGDGAVTKLRQNPYRLAEDIPGIAFRGADKIAMEMGIAQDAAQRIEAGLLHVLREAARDGHVFLPAGDLQETAAELLGAPQEATVTALDALVQREEAGREAASDAVYLPMLLEAERNCAKRLLRLHATPCDAVEVKFGNAFRWVEKMHGITLSDEQRDAIRTGVRSKVMVITGGPGTGKTTVLRGLLAILEKKGVSFLLAAPTGRAAKRMEDATRCDARTLHRLLEFSPKTGAFIRNAHNPLDTDLLVVDEASMLDTLLLDATLSALPAFARLILVGDVDQLPSVGAGNCLFDIIASGVLPVVRLRSVFRQDARSGIIAAAHGINQGKYPQFNEEDCYLIERDGPKRALETIIELVTRRIPEGFGLDPLRDVQVLSPMRRGDAGVNRINEALQEALNPDGAPVPRCGLRVGDKVMQLRNNYDLDVYNGDIGVITLLDEKASEIEVSFDDQRRVLYRFDDLDDLGLAYATTVHKSQGSEYPVVVLAFLPQHYMMLQRNVLYTGLTRARDKVIVVGHPKAIAAAVRNNKVTRRNTLLAERLRKTV